MYEQVHLPSGAVAWTSAGSPATTLAADGCVDLILRHDVVLVAGPSTRWLTTTADASNLPTVGLRFSPGSAASVLGTDLGALRDTAVALEQVVSRPRALQLMAQMRDLAGQLPDRDPQRLVELAPRSTSPEWAQLVLAAARKGSPVSEVRSELGWSESTLRRSVLAQFGFGIPVDDSWLPFWAFLSGVLVPVIGLVVAVVALRRRGMGTVAQGLVWVGVAAALAHVVAALVVVLLH
ncbi:hypothetical protein SAMN06264364_15511 [Quadrisphaera granulorum]|uniref:DUF6597 domain-containing protein n=1 Tax=Quadrisphaera granulorum TaxID=317664 RepID=A0A315ZKM3_9ACTN|nr:DUF6597 domain-containing transcriptional factor [Quadrisphaera granulorum]PWJ45560.1 hypothetical protein BXY45_15511 [Quadrisphaera granulorum]SZE99175.1 hypothetical protein SAMN06264364_15511 [Quadrisphaera granulorum]